MKVADVIIKKMLTCGGPNAGVTFSSNEGTCISETTEFKEPCQPSKGMFAPSQTNPSNKASLGLLFPRGLRSSPRYGGR